MGLTVAGLARVAGAEPIVDGFLRLVGAMGRIRDAIQLNPFSDTRPVVTRPQILELTGEFAVDEGLVLELMPKEPPTWHCQANRQSGEEWTVELSPQIRRFAAVADVADYLERLAKFTAPQEQAPESEVISPFTLPGAIDFLDAVWKARFGKGLVVPPGIERSARLASTAENADEANSCMSALAEVLKSLQVPGVSGLDAGHPLQRLGPFLADRLPAEGQARVQAAIEVLNAARGIRAGAQHHSAQSAVIPEYEVLGLGYPVTDWGSAWERIQRLATNAFDAIREEIQASA